MLSLENRQWLELQPWVEICRSKKNVDIPDDLCPAYFESLALLPSLVAQASSRSWDSNFLACALAAVAAAKGQPGIAEAALELTPEVAQEFLELFFDLRVKGTDCRK